MQNEKEVVKMLPKKLYRAATGWLERTMEGGDQHQQGIETLVVVQKGNAKSLGKAIEQAKFMGRIGAWIEEDGVPAHRPTGPVKIKRVGGK